jgi:hypothetical protein
MLITLLYVVSRAPALLYFRCSSCVLHHVTGLIEPNALTPLHFGDSVNESHSTSLLLETQLRTKRNAFIWNLISSEIQYPRLSIQHSVASNVLLQRRLFSFPKSKTSWNNYVWFLPCLSYCTSLRNYDGLELQPSATIPFWALPLSEYLSAFSLRLTLPNTRAGKN